MTINGHDHSKKVVVSVKRLQSPTTQRKQQQWAQAQQSTTEPKIHLHCKYSMVASSFWRLIMTIKAMITAKKGLCR
jgi:hypothetical protein